MVRLDAASPSTSRPDWALIGAGRLGTRLAAGLAATGWRLRLVRSRSPHEPDLLPARTVCDTWGAPWPVPRLAVVFVCVPDAAVGDVARQLAAEADLTGAAVLHTSGLHTCELLAPCRDNGAAVASWHPLLAFPSPQSTPVSWAGAPCAVEGDLPAVDIGFAAAHDLGLLPWRIRPEDKPLYHAAAAVASNLTHILVAAAARLIADCGLPAEGGPSGLQPLVMGSVEAALSAPGGERLTGAIARGDWETVAAHLAVLPPPLAKVYEALIPLVRESRAKT